MDINCDLGEGEPLARTRALMRRISSANIACGGHAGDQASISACLRLCDEFNVNPGAHPGFEDRKNFGRKDHPITPGKLRDLLARQIAALLRPPVHVKLHGALYHVVEQDAALARAFVAFIKKEYPRTRIFALAEGRVVRTAHRQGVEAWGEIFAERGYEPSGALMPRGTSGAVLGDIREIQRRAQLFKDTGEIAPVGKIEAATICVHSDTPGAVRIADVLRRVLIA